MAKPSLTLEDFVVKKAATVTTPGSITLYGPPGRGKSVLGGSIVKVPGFEKTLILDVEGSAVAVGEHHPEADVVRIKTAAEFDFIAEALLSGQFLEPESQTPYDVVIIDTFDKAQERQLDVFDKFPEAKNNSFFKWGAIRTWTNKVADAFHSAPFLTIFILHSDEGRQDTNKALTTVALQGSSQDVFPSVSDAVGYVDITKIKEEGGTKEVRTVDFRPSSRFISKQRFADKLDGIFADPTFTKIFERIQPERFTNETSN